VSYAAQYWVDHAKFRGVASQIQDEMKRLFDPSEPFLARWTSIHDVDRGWAATSVLRGCQWIVEPKGTPLYYAALCGFSGLAEHLIATHKENVHAKCGTHGTPLHAASAEGHLDTVRVLLDHGAEPNTADKRKRTPLYAAYSGGHLQVMELLLERGADMDMPTNGS
jgi:ankyrin repeat protein